MVLRIKDEHYVKERLKDEDFVIVSGLPLSGKTTLISKIENLCRDFLKCKEGEILYIQLPNYFNNEEELEKWRKLIEDLKGKRKIILEGRNYVIKLVLGKVTLSKEISLSSPDIYITGNAVTYDSLNALKLVSDLMGEKPSEVILYKILEYSSVTIFDYTTIIPKLVEEAVQLYKKNKLDNILKIVKNLKLLFYSFPKNEKIVGEDAILLSILLVLPNPEEIKKIWSELSDSWKELIYYRIDSALRLLPGKAKSVIENFLEDNIKLEISIKKAIEFKPKYLRNEINSNSILDVSNFVKFEGEDIMVMENNQYKSVKVIPFHDEIQIATSYLLNETSLRIVGNVFDGKTTLAKLILYNLHSLAPHYVIVDGSKENSIEIAKKIRENGGVVLIYVDYHSDGENYLNIEKIYNLSKNINNLLYLAVLTYDLDRIKVFYNSKRLSFKRVVQKYLSYAPNFKILNEQSKSLIFSTSFLKYVLYVAKGEISDEVIQNYKKDYQNKILNYIIKVIFNNNESKIKEYYPLFILSRIYHSPIPMRLSSEVFGLKDEVILKWFNSGNVSYYSKVLMKNKGLKFDKNVNKELIEKIQNFVLNTVKGKVNLEEELLEIYSKIIMGDENSIGKNFEDILGSKINNLNSEVILGNVDLNIDSVFDKLEDNYLLRVNDYCNKIKELSKMVMEDIIKTGDINITSAQKYWKGLIENFGRILSILISPNSSLECFSEAIMHFPFITRVAVNLDWFLKYNDNIVGRILREKDENLAYEYLKGLFPIVLYDFDHIQPKISGIISDIIKISGITEATRLYANTLLVVINYHLRNNEEVLRLISEIDNIKVPEIPRLLFKVTLITELIENAMNIGNVGFIDKIYEKFIESFNRFKSIVKKINEEQFLEVQEFFFIKFMHVEDMKEYLYELDSKILAYLASIYFKTCKEENITSLLKDLEKSTEGWYNVALRKIKGKNFDSSDLELLFNTIKIRLAKSLMTGGRYEYKTHLQSIIDLFNNIKYLINSFELIGSLAVAKDLAEASLKGIINKSYLGYQIFYDIASALLGNEESKKEFYDKLEAYAKDIATEEKSSVNDELGELGYLLNYDLGLVGLLFYYLFKNDIEKFNYVINYIKNNLSGCDFKVLLNLIEKFKINERVKPMLIASLILFI
jgi:hypothetical protein